MFLELWLLYVAYGHLGRANCSTIPGPSEELFGNLSIFSVNRGANLSVLEQFNLDLKARYPEEIFLEDFEIRFCEGCILNGQMFLIYPHRARRFQEGYISVCEPIMSRNRHKFTPYALNYVLNHYECGESFYPRRFNVSEIPIYHPNGTRFYNSVLRQRHEKLMGIDESLPPILTHMDWVRDHMSYLTLGQLRAFTFVLTPYETWSQTMDKIRMIPIYNLISAVVKFFTH